jgi:hypothetical protein
MGPLLQLAPHKIAAVAMRVVIDQLTQSPKFQALAYALAERLWLETMLARASEYELKSHQRVRRRFKQKRADAMRMRNSEIWTPQEKLSVGVFLVHLVEQHTGLIEIYAERGAMRAVKRVRGTQAALDWVRGAEEQQRLLCPFALPTVIPPRDWSDPMTGGYWTEDLPGNTLFKENNEPIAARSSEFDAFVVAANIQQGVEDDAWVEAKSLVATIEDHELVDPTLSSERLLYRLFHERGVKVFEGQSVQHACRCSTQRIEDMLRGFTVQERKDMVGDNGRIGVTCEFCSTHRDFDPKDFDV